MRLIDVPTPAFVVAKGAFDFNLATMTARWPGDTLRPHVKAHKTSKLAAAQQALGHQRFTCATPLEMVVMAREGVGTDLLLANETLDPQRLQAMAAMQDKAMMTVAIDSPETLEAAAAAGIKHVIIDVNVGLPRCGAAPDKAPALADAARAKGVTVRGVMGYEGHLMMAPADALTREAHGERVLAAMEALLATHCEIGGDIVSGGGTGVWDLNTAVNELQAGSYALMDTYYATLPIPFQHAAVLWCTVVSTSDKWAVCDAGLKSLGMDHGNPSITGSKVWFASDEHVTFAPADRDTPLHRPGTRVAVLPAHIDPTCSQHERMYIADAAGVGDLTNDTEIIDVWPIDMRGW